MSELSLEEQQAILEGSIRENLEELEWQERAFQNIQSIVVHLRERLTKVDKLAFGNLVKFKDQANYEVKKWKQVTEIMETYELYKLRMVEWGRPALPLQDFHRTVGPKSPFKRLQAVEEKELKIGLRVKYSDKIYCITGFTRDVRVIMSGFTGSVEPYHLEKVLSKEKSH